MRFEVLLQQAIDYGQNNRNLVLPVVAVLLLLTFFKPRTMMKIYGACVLVLIGLYLVSLLGGVLSSGHQQKHQMIDKTRQATGE